MSVTLPQNLSNLRGDRDITRYPEREVIWPVLQNMSWDNDKHHTLVTHTHIYELSDMA